MLTAKRHLQSCWTSTLSFGQHFRVVVTNRLRFLHMCKACRNHVTMVFQLTTWRLPSVPIFNDVSVDRRGVVNLQVHCGQMRVFFAICTSRRTQFLQRTIYLHMKFLLMSSWMQILHSLEPRRPNTPYSPHTPTGAGCAHASRHHPLGQSSWSTPSRRSPEETRCEQLVLHRNARVTWDAVGTASDQGICNSCNKPFPIQLAQRHGPSTRTCLTRLPTPESDMRHLEIEVHAASL